VWPKWLRKFASHPIGIYQYGISSDPAGWNRFSRASFDHKARVPCEPCNHRLGTELEAVVSPLVERLLSTEVTLIPPDEQRLLSQWLYKTGLMVATTMPSDAAALPRKHYEGLASSFDLPPGSIVWIGLLEKRLQEAGLWVQRFEWRDKLLTDPPAAEGYLIVLGVLNIAAMVGVLDLRQSPASTDMNPFMLGERGVGRFLRIWPASTFYAQPWPPPLTVQGDDLSRIADAFVTFANERIDRSS